MGNKYNVSPKEERTWNGKVYASKAEARYAEHLNNWLVVEIKEIIEQPRLWLGVPENKYVPDFFIVYNNGDVEYVDVKGAETAKFKRDKKLWKAYARHPLRIVKYNYKTGTFPTSEVITPD